MGKDGARCRHHDAVTRGYASFTSRNVDLSSPVMAARLRVERPLSRTS